MPYPTEATVDSQHLNLARCVSESGNVRKLPWHIAGFDSRSS